MNPKSFVGKFSEIAHFNSEDQTAILEKAQYEAFVKLNLAGRATAYLVLCMVAGFVVGMTPLFIFGFSNFLALPPLATGMLLSILVYQRLYRKLLQRGLSEVLEVDAAEQRIQQ